MALGTPAMLARYLPARRVSDENAISRFEITFARGASISVEVPSPSPHSLLATASVQDWIADKVSAKHLLCIRFSFAAVLHVDTHLGHSFTGLMLGELNCPFARPKLASNVWQTQDPGVGYFRPV
jgi:hypothetical protein